MKKLFSLCFALVGLVLATACGDNPKVEPTPPVSNDLVIKTAKRYISADGKDAATFTVELKGVDVTATSKFYDVTSGSSKPLSAASFTTTEAGVYTFYAVSGSIISARITVQGATFFPEMPTDLVPEKFDFVKRVMGSQFTSATCSWCPRLKKAMHDYLATPDADKVVFVGFHCYFPDPYIIPKGVVVADEFTGSSIPFISFAMSKDRQNGGDFSKSSELKEIVDRLIKVPAVTGMSASVAVKDGKICVRADVKVREQGAIKIGAVLVEDDLFATQLNQTGLKEDYFDTHNYVLRDYCPFGEKALYEDLGGLSTVPAKSKQQFYCEFDVEQAELANIANARVIIFTYDETKALSDNIISVNLDSKYEFQYL